MAKVLIVEDEPLVARMYQEALSFDKHEVEIAVGGKEGIEKALQGRPDIILLDVMMPELDGMQVLKTLKSKDDTKDIPIVMLTNLSGKYDKELAKKYGASDYWTKTDVDYRSLGKNIVGILDKAKEEGKEVN